MRSLSAVIFSVINGLMRMFFMTSGGEKAGDDLVGVVHEDDLTAVHDVIGAQVAGRHDAVLGQIAAAQVERAAELECAPEG